MFEFNIEGRGQLVRKNCILSQKYNTQLLHFFGQGKNNLLSSVTHILVTLLCEIEVETRNLITWHSPLDIYL